MSARKLLCCRRSSISKSEFGEPGFEQKRGTYNLISNIMPNIRFPNRTPLARSPNIPSERRIRSSALATNPSSLQLREMALEETDLVLAVYAGGIGRASFDAEMVPYFSGVDRGFGLGDQFGASHRLAVPVGGTVEGELCALLGACVCGVLVGGR